MAEYYLISQLPSLDGIGENTPLPINEQRFLELCSQHLGKKAKCEIEKLTITPPIDLEKTGSALLDAWYEGERNLSLALGKVRAEKMNKSFVMEKKTLPIELVKAASEALEADNPLEAEKLLFAFRLNFLESLRPMDAFSEDFLFYYGLKLKLIMRMRQFDAKSGEDAYREIYKSILSGDRMEVIR